MTSLFAKMLIFFPLLPPLKYSTPIATLFLKLTFVTNAFVIILRFCRDLAGLRNAFAALTLNLPRVVRCT